MITPSFGLTATERVLPKLALDFTTASLDSRITFTRTTDATHPATYVNSSGNIIAATNDQPRFDYDPVTLSCKGLLIEESRTNICLQSDNFGSATWGRTSGTTVRTNTSVSPDGTANADTIVLDGTTNAGVNQLVTVTTGAPWTFSVYMRVTSGTLSIRIGNLIYGVYESKVVTTTWQRFSVTQIPVTTARSVQILRDGVTGNVEVYGAQLELGAFATSYIPTTSAALTRNADVATMTGTNFSDWFNASEGTFMSEFTYSFNSTASVRVLTGDNASSDLLTYLQSNTNSIRANDGSATITLGVGLPSATNKVCFGYSGGRLQGAANGALGGIERAYVKTATMTQLQLSPQAPINGHFKKLFYYKQRLTVSELVAFSK